MNRTKREQTASMRTAVKAITSFIGLLAAIAAPAQTRVIDQQWQFSTDPKAQFTPTTVGRAATWRPAQPNLSWNAQYADLRDYAGVGWYRVNVTLPAPQSSTRELIHFGAVDYLTRVWVNGLLLGEHEGGYTPFTFDLTGKVHAGYNEILVRVFDPPMPPLSLHSSRTLRRRKKC
jgi:beta-galactosidase/beta-glucuronidase